MRCVLLFVAVLAVTATSVSAQRKNRALVPANFNAKTDSQGFMWDINQAGSIDDGTNDCFDGAQILTVNGQQFSAQQPLMTADGSELVLNGKLPNLDVTRRIKVDPALAFVRYVDSLTNTSNSSQNVAVLLYSNMGGAPQPIIFDSGRPAAGALAKDETGLLAYESPQGGRPAVFFYLCGPRSRVKPQVMATQGGDDIQITYNLTLRPGRTVSIVHAIAQRRFQSVPDPKAMATLVKPLNSRKYVRDLPADVRRSIVNGGGQVYGAGGPLSFTVAAAVGIEPETIDILAFGEETRLRGTTTCERIAITNRFGTQKIELENVAAVIGSRRLGKVSRVFLRDGQVLSGQLELDGLRFTENTGVELPLNVNAIDRMVLHTTPDDGKPAAEAQAYVETYQGDRLAVAYAEDKRLGIVTPWGNIDVPLDEVLWFRPPESGQPGHHVRLKDGSGFFAYLEGTPLEMRTLLFGNQSVKSTEIRGFRSAGGRPEDESDEDVTLPHIIMNGGHVLVGHVDLGGLRMRTHGELIELVPDQIRLLRNMSDQSEEPLSAFQLPLFAAEMWGGSIVVGSLEDRTLPVRFASQLCRVPIRDIAEVHVPTPSVSDSLRKRIAAAIQDLGHADFKKRERATEELVGIGYLAKALLQEAIAQTNDPEIRRRAESLLTEIDE